MIHDIVGLCREYPQVLVFLALGIGYAVGKIRVRGFGLGSTASVLLVALVIGQITVTIPELLSNISFALFIFCIGYKVGPQFFGALKKEGLSYIWISLVVAFTALATAIILGKIFGFDKGTTAGLFSGSMTISAAIGTAQGAISHLSASAAEKSVLDSNVVVAYAITYIFGTVGGIIFFRVAPGLCRINLKDEAKRLEQKMSGSSSDIEKSPELFSWSKQLNLRAYQATNSATVGKSVKQLEGSFPGKVAVEKIKRGDQLLVPSPDTAITQDDYILIAGADDEFLNVSDIIGPEKDIAGVSDMIGEMIEVCVLHPKVVGKTLGDFSNSAFSHGIFLMQVTRQGHKLPLVRDTAIEKCDVFRIIGAKEDIDRAVRQLGYAERPTAITDLVMVGIGCVLGTLIGLLAVKIGDIPITLGVGGGVLVSGLFFGWLRAVHPTFGQIPSGGQWILTDLGLNLFIACLGLTAGAKALHALQTTGLTVFCAGVILTLVPVTVGLLFGKIILKMNPVLLFGSLTGARALTAALNTLQEEADSSTPVLGYAAPYAFGNVLLTVWGTIIVNVM